MRYEEFKEQLVAEVKKYYGDTAIVTAEDVIKNNGQSYEGLKIMKHSKHQKHQVMPVIQLQHVYERYQQEEMELEQFAKQLCRFLEKEEENPVITAFADKLSQWDKVKEQVYPVLMLTKKNQDLLKSLVTTKFLDMSVIYRICETTEEDGLYSISINPAMLNNYGITVEQLHEQAVKNLKKQDYQFISMESYARQLLQFMGMEEEKYLKKDYDYVPMYVLTNENKLYGASGILDKEQLQEFADGKNYFIILSCVHEAILVPDDGGKDKEELNKIIKETYDTVVMEEERLSEHCYYYNGATGEISMDE